MPDLENVWTKNYTLVATSIIKEEVCPVIKHIELYSNHSRAKPTIIRPYSIMLLPMRHDILLARDYILDADFILYTYYCVEKYYSTCLVGKIKNSRYCLSWDIDSHKKEVISPYIDSLIVKNLEKSHNISINVI